MLQLSQRPLTGSAADRALFTNRQGELERLERAARLNFNVLLLGDRGSGISSLMQQHVRHLEELGRTVFYISAARAESLGELLQATRIGVLGRRQPIIYEEHPTPDYGALLRASLIPTPDPRVVTIPGDPDPLLTLRQVGAALVEAKLTSEGYPIVLLDDVADPKLVHELFGRHRDEVWEVPIRWVVAGERSRRHRYIEPPADAFFDTEVTLEPLDEIASRNLIRARLSEAEPDETAVALIEEQLDEIVERGAGNPRRLLAAARDATLRTPQETAATDRVFTAAEALGASEVAAVRHLQIHGPTSASDPELLSTLGTSRARATQVLRHLEEEGLVMATNEKGGVGRPRKLYAIKAKDVTLPGGKPQHIHHLDSDHNEAQ